MNMRKERSVKWRGGGGREEFIIFHWNEYIDDDDDNFEMFYVYIDHLDRKSVV